MEDLANSLYRHIVPIVEAIGCAQSTLCAGLRMVATAILTAVAVCCQTAGGVRIMSSGCVLFGFGSSSLLRRTIELFNMFTSIRVQIATAQRSRSGLRPQALPASIFLTSINYPSATPTHSLELTIIAIVI